MDALLTRLFDYQGFEGNAALAGVIATVHGRWGMRGLTAEEMGAVAAAGIIAPARNPIKPPEGH